MAKFSEVWEVLFTAVFLAICRVARVKPSDSRDVEKRSSRENKAWGRGKCAFSLLSSRARVVSEVNFHSELSTVVKTCGLNTTLLVSRLSALFRVFFKQVRITNK